MQTHETPQEALNVMFCMCKKLQERQIEDEFLNLRLMFEEVLDDISSDRQPEIKPNLLKTS